MTQLLENSGYQATEKAGSAEVVVVNTCGFIGPAREESYRALEELAASKRSGQVLIAAGCLTQRYGLEVMQKVPGVDGILGTRRWMDIVKVVENTRHGEAFQNGKYDLDKFSGEKILPEITTESEPLPDLGERLLGIALNSPGELSNQAEKGILRAAIQGGSAYLKIADGCRRPCAFCAIPLIKGTAVSRPMEVILDEARQLQERGVKEIILIAQDTTDYGHDLCLQDGLAQLLERLVQTVPGIPWLRILYAFPGSVTDRLIEIMASHQQITPYLDMPLQHAHPATLRRMRRPANIDWVFQTLEKIRRAIPDLALRSTFIVGYPGETEQEFTTLLDFLREIRFDRVGAFQFSFEPGTSSEPLGDPIPPEVKQERYERLMAVQQPISLEKNLSLVGKSLPILLEGHGDGIFIGRSYRDAPEIDGMVIVEDYFKASGRKHSALRVGEIVPVRITGAMTYDLSGVPATGDRSLLTR
jgi:ribosomal protein S12 methylthiotransferase